MKEVTFEADKKISRKGQNVSQFYIVLSGGAILKNPNDEDRIFMSGDFIDPLSLVTFNSSGDVYAVGKTILLCGNREEIVDFMKKHPKVLHHAIIRIIESLSYNKDRNDETNNSVEELLAHLTAKRQFFIDKYPPLIIGEKPLYRKAISLLRKGDYDGAIAYLESYLSQFANSPLERPVRMFLALAEISREGNDRAIVLMLKLLKEAPDHVSKYVHEMLRALGLKESAFVVTFGTPNYPEGFLRYIQEQYPDKLKTIENEMVIFENGAIADAVYFVVSGEIRLVKKRENGFLKLKEITKGDSFGEIHTLCAGKWDVTAVANKGSKIVVLDKETFLNTAIKKNPEAGLVLMDYLLNFQKELLHF